MTISKSLGQRKFPLGKKLRKTTKNRLAPRFAHFIYKPGTPLMFTYKTIALAS